MDKTNNLPILANNKMPIERKRNIKRIKQNAKRMGKIALNAGIAVAGLGISAIGGPVTATIGTGMYVISGVNAGKQIIYKKHDKNSMFVTRTDMKGETKLSQDITEFRAFNKMKGFEPQEKGALMGLEMLVGLQNYKQQFSDQNKRKEISVDGENNVYTPVFKTKTHGINIKTIEALEKLGYIQIEQKEPTNKSLLILEKLQFKQYEDVRKALNAKITSDKETINKYEKQMYEVKFRLTDKPLNLEELYKQYSEVKTERGNAPLKRIGIILEALKDKKIDVKTDNLGINKIEYDSQESLAKRVIREMESKNSNKKFRESQHVDIGELENKRVNERDIRINNEVNKDIKSIDER